MEKANPRIRPRTGTGRARDHALDVDDGKADPALSLYRHVDRQSAQPTKSDTSVPLLMTRQQKAKLQNCMQFAPRVSLRPHTALDRLEARVGLTAKRRVSRRRLRRNRPGRPPRTTPCMAEAVFDPVD